MNFVKKIFSTIKPSLTRFFGMYLLCACSSVFASILVVNEMEYSRLLLNTTETILQLLFSFSWMIGFSVLLKLAFEKFFPIENKHSKICRLMVNLIPLVLCVPLFFCARSFETSARFYQTFGCLFGSVFFGIMYFFQDEAKEKNCPNLFGAFVISFILTVLVAASISLILFAVNKLIAEISCFESLIAIVWIAAGYLIFIGSMISYATKDYDEIVVSKAIKVIFLYALLPLFCVYILVLYAYFLKSLFTLTMPSGLINPFVTAATFVYMILYLILMPYKNGATKIFYKYGAFFLIPLVILQIAGFSIRISNYGFTIPRYISLIYILFSIAFLILAVVKGFWKKDLPIGKYSFLILSALLIFLSLPKVNPIDVRNNSMVNRIEKIYKSHNLFKDGLLLTYKADSILSWDEKQTIKSAFYEIEYADEKSIPWLKSGFYPSFGFNPSDEKEEKLGMLISGKPSEIDISEYSFLHEIYSTQFTETPEPVLTITTTDSKTFVLKEELEGVLYKSKDFYTNKIDGPVKIISKDKTYEVIITSASITPDSYQYCNGFILEK